MNKYVWWKHGVLYQIYPRSFYDSNGDGIGDLNGVIDKLDYIKSLGVEGIWFSPINNSPMFDFGYDISDYRGIDPVFGTMDSFDRLLEETHRRGMKIILDLVLNHTSHMHPWFVESQSSKDNSKRNWYIWHPGKNGKVPNNWKSVFGGSAWEFDKNTGEYYLHSFLKEQPDVNWRNPELKKAVFNDIKFWLDKGVDGFRLDVANCFIKDKEFRNNPYFIGKTPRPYDMQKHIYDKNRPEVHDIFFKDFRNLLDGYTERMSVGEIFIDDPEDHSQPAEYLGNGDNELHLAFDFSLLMQPWNPQKIMKCLHDWYFPIPANGWPCQVMSNHDVPRAVSRFKKSSEEETDARAKIAAVLLLTVKGTPFVYYGEEIGMRNGKILKNEIVDPVGLRYWPFFRGRDPERTPMQWNNKPHSGFTAGKPWLPVNRDFLIRNVNEQEKDPSSMLNFYRQLISLRQARKALYAGDWSGIDLHNKRIIAYERACEEERMLVILNFSSRHESISIGNIDQWRVVFPESVRLKNMLNSDVKLSPYEVIVAERIN